MEIQIQLFLLLLLFLKLMCLVRSVQPTEIATEWPAFNYINIKWTLCFVLRFSSMGMNRDQSGRHSPVDRSSFSMGGMPLAMSVFPCVADQGIFLHFIESKYPTLNSS